MAPDFQAGSLQSPTLTFLSHRPQELPSEWRSRANALHPVAPAQALCHVAGLEQQ